MMDIASLVPGFHNALELLPGMPSAYGKLDRSLDQGALSPRMRVMIHLVVAGYVRCDYCEWVMARAAEHSGLTAEEILFASIGTSRNPQEAGILSIARRVVSGGVTAERIRLDQMEARLYGEVELAEIAAHVALAVLTCSVLQAIAPGRVPAGKEA